MNAAGQLLALSVREPHFSALVDGFKPIEGRTRRPPARLLNRPLALQCAVAPAADAHVARVRELTGRTFPEPGRQCFGKIGGACVVKGYLYRLNGEPRLHTGEGPDINILRFPKVWATWEPWWDEVKYPYGWVVGQAVRLIEPKMARGFLGLWAVHPITAASVLEQYAAGVTAQNLLKVQRALETGT
jgi:hypothetical protein